MAAAANGYVPGIANRGREMPRQFSRRRGFVAPRLAWARSRRWLAALALAAAGTVGAAPPQYRLEVVATHPHDARAYTQGLLWADGRLYESTGKKGRSSVRRVAPATGEVERRTPLADRYFGEGLAKVGDRLVQLTWKAGTGFVYDADSLARRSSFSYAGQGWGLTYDGDRLIMSDGSATLRFLDPETLAVTGTLTVTAGDQPLPRLNELEMVRGELWANVYPTDLIVRIDPADGRVTGVIRAASLRDHLPAGHKVDVLNGIAYDPEGDRIFVTGKLWPRLFEVRVLSETTD